MSEKPVDDTVPTAEKWLDDWIRLGTEAIRDGPAGPSALEILQNDRNRLEQG
ncbi:MAG: hypothetical protein ABIQ99_19360 [Thermoflexales bacterium]